MHNRLWLGLLILAGSVGCSSTLIEEQTEKRATPPKIESADPLFALKAAKSFELYSIVETPDKIEKEDLYFRYKSFGKTTITDPAVRESLISALDKVIDPHRSGADCFWPRHAIRVNHQGKRYDFIICFQCKWMYVSEDGIHKQQIRIERSPEPIFDKVLIDAGVPLAPKAESK